MQIQKSFKGQTPYGKLYLVATPIGNLDDMTFRAIQTLKEVDWIAAEDTRNTGLLLKHFDISTKQISFHEHNAKEKIPDLIGFLKAGQSIAQVSDAGLPSISDPGHDLVNRSCYRSRCFCRDFCLDCKWFSTAATYLLRFLTEKIRSAKAIFRLEKRLSRNSDFL